MLGQAQWTRPERPRKRLYVQAHRLPLGHSAACARQRSLAGMPLPAWGPQLRRTVERPRVGQVELQAAGCSGLAAGQVGLAVPATLERQLARLAARVPAWRHRIGQISRLSACDSCT